MNQIIEIAELVSLFLTVPAIFLSLVVVFIWSKEAIIALYTNIDDRSAMQWLMIGIFFGFMGAVGDNFYWGIVWSLTYIKHPFSQDAFLFGSIFNVFFRQLLGIIAAYCHIIAFTKVQSESSYHKYSESILWSLSIAIGLAYIVTLSFLKIEFSK